MLHNARWAAMIDYYESIIEDSTDLEAFARCAEFCAEHANGDAEQFIHDMGYLIFGQIVPRTGIIAGPFDRINAVTWRKLGWAFRETAMNRFGSRGFAYDDKSNQVQHFWYAVAVCGARASPTSSRSCSTGTHQAGCAGCR